MAATARSETARLFETTDWSTTAIGPRSRWPRTLLAHSRTLLALDYPIIVFWGPRLVQLYNDAYRPILGTKHPHAFGRPAAESWPEIWDRVGPMLEAVLATGVANRVEDLLLPIDRCGTGLPDPAYFTFSYGPLEDDAGGVGGVFCAVHETTPGVLAVRALRAEERAKDEFLATLAHELRNPLAPIRNAVEILRLGVDGAGAGRAIEVLDRQVRQLGRLLDDLTDVSQIARGTIQLRRDALELGDVVARAIETVAPLFERRRQRFALELADEPLPLVGDADRLTQAVANLLTNACRYAEPEGSITLRAGRDGDGVQIRVVDDGIGIAPAALERIFDLFAQAETMPGRSRGGSGIGLTLTRRIVELHGGTIEARSAGHGAGSEFVVRLPLAAASASASVATPDRAPLPSRRVLVVDDDRDVAESMHALLVQLGHEVRIAHDGPSAILAATELRPDLAILDLALPGMTGWDLAPLLRRIEGLAQVSLVALSGYGDDGARERTRRSGFDAHLLKPIDRDTLDEVLRRAERRTP